MKTIAKPNTLRLDLEKTICYFIEFIDTYQQIKNPMHQCYDIDVEGITDNLKKVFNELSEKYDKIELVVTDENK